MKNIKKYNKNNLPQGVQQYLRTPLVLSFRGPAGVGIYIFSSAGLGRSGPPFSPLSVGPSIMPQIGLRSIYVNPFDVVVPQKSAARDKISILRHIIISIGSRERATIMLLGNERDEFKEKKYD